MTQKLAACHIKCQHQIIGLHWHHIISNVLLPTGHVNTVVRYEAGDWQSTGIFVGFLKMLQCGSKCNSLHSGDVHLAFMDSSDGTSQGP